MSAGRSFIGSARVIALWTLGSRITGLIRDILINRAFGQSWVQDAYNYGFLIPNLFRRLFGEGALSAVFVPTFTETLHRDGRPAAWTLLGRVLARFTALLVALTMLIELVLLICWQLAPGGPRRQLLLGLTAVMLPFMTSICLVALFSGILNCLGRFGIPAATPIILNLCMIVGIEVIGPRIGEAPERRVYGVAISVLIAGVVQLIALWPALRREGVRMPMAWGGRDAALRGMAAAFFPVMLGQGVLLIGAFLDAQICTTLSRVPGQADTFSFFGRETTLPLEAGALSAVNNAMRLYQFPLGVLAISLATAALPAFSRFAAQRDFDGLRLAHQRALRLAVFEGLPCGVMLTLLAAPIVELLFQYGRYTAADTVRAAAVLRWYGVGVWAFCAQHVVIRGFYALKDTRTPMWIGVALVPLNLGLSLALIWLPAVREQAFGVSTTLTTAINVGASLLLLRRRLGGRVGGTALLTSLIRSAIATAAAACVAWLLLDPARTWAADWFGGASAGWRVAAGRAVTVFVPLLAAVAVYFASAVVLRMDEVRWIRRSERDSAKGAEMAGAGNE